MSLLASSRIWNLYIEKLYKEHLPNKKYDSQFKVLIDPCNSNQYILLTIGAMQTWAHSPEAKAKFIFQLNEQDGRDSP
ncbi:hypothetical protein VP01_6351g1 [Puccinia sorghi]|uniref:Uncharacterized protein n=1 Tax=Puccinia sorghi TaxID=27349 RepID=A0A0L6UGX4_9BASI|nr:hypothetical protein VP01_6351g1 [Puccinia sorghi]